MIRIKPLQFSVVPCLVSHDGMRPVPVYNHTPPPTRHSHLNSSASQTSGFYTLLFVCSFVRVCSSLYAGRLLFNYLSSVCHAASCLLAGSTMVTSWALFRGISLSNISATASQAFPHTHLFGFTASSFVHSVLGGFIVVVYSQVSASNSCHVFCSIS